MSQPGQPGQVVPQDPYAALMRRIENIERTQREQGALLVKAGTIQSPNFDGVAASNTVGTLGYGLDGPTGNAVFNNIALRGGIIGNDALSNPSSFGVVNNSAGSLTFPVSSFGSYASATFTVPAGFTRALVSVVGVAVASAPSGSIGLLAQSTIGAGIGPQVLTAGAVPSSVAPYAAQLTGLTGGGTITVAVQAGVTNTMTAGSGGAYLSGFAVFLR